MGISKGWGQERVCNSSTVWRWELCLQRLKLLKTLLFESTNEHVEHSCYKEDLTENNLMFIEECFDRVCDLTDVEYDTVTYIDG